MINEFGKKGFKQIKKLMKKLEKKKESLEKQEDLLILEKERNLALEEELVKEKEKVEKLAMNLSLANDSKERMSKDLNLANDSLAKLKNSHSELQENFSCLDVKFKELEVNYNALWDNTSSKSKATLNSNASTSEGCSKCYKFNVNDCLTNIAKLEDSIKAKDNQINRLNMLVRLGYDGDERPKTKVNYDVRRHSSIMDGLGLKRGKKTNGKQVTKGWEGPVFTKGTNLGDLMNIAHGVPKSNVNQEVINKIKNEKKSKGKGKVDEIVHEPSPSYTNDYMITMDRRGKMVVKYVGAYTKKSILRSVWVPRMFLANLK